MKITWLAGQLDGWTTGRTMVRLLKRWDRHTHPIRIVCWGSDAYVADACDRLEVHCDVLPGSQSRNFRHRRDWWRKLLATRADIWHCWSNEERFWIRAARMMGASHPTIHPYGEIVWETGSRPIPTDSRRPSAALDDLSGDYAGLLHQAVQGDRLVDSLAGCRDDRASAAHSEPWRIATISRMQRNCRVEHLIWSLALLRHNFPTVWLDICGNGPARERVMQYAARTGTSGIFLVDNATSWSRILNRAHCLWLGNDEPGLESMVAESLHRKIPVVAADSTWSRQFGERNRLLHRVPRGRAGRADLARLTTQWLIDTGAPQRQQPSQRVSLAV